MPAVFFIYNMNSLEGDQPMRESRWKVYIDC
jgi:hypothetical protein